MGETTVDRWNERVKPDKARVAPSEAGGELGLSYFPRPGDAAEFDEKVGAPGVYPFTRGVYPAMYRDRMWQMRLYSGFGTIQSCAFNSWKRDIVRTAILKGRRGIATELNPSYFLDGCMYLAAAERDKSMPTLFDTLTTDEVEAA